MEWSVAQDGEYASWLSGLKSKIRASQIKAAVQVNYELLSLYWQLGVGILQKQKEAHWGDALIPQLSADLLADFPGMTGFSRTNLFYIKKWVLFYTKEIVPQAAGQSYDMPPGVGQIPWGHNREIITKCKTVAEALFYTTATIKNNWSRTVLINQIKTGLYSRAGAAIDNFTATLPPYQASLARETTKSPYVFDFLTIDEDSRERDLEAGLVEHIQKFLLELGRGYAYMGRQYKIRIAGKDYPLDLLFYQVHLRAFIVVEIKITPFEPEFAGKLNFYLNGVNDQLKHHSDQPSIGILLCKTSDRVVVEYALKNVNSPIGVATYHLTKSLPQNLKEELPSIEQLTAELTDKKSF